MLEKIDQEETDLSNQVISQLKEICKTKQKAPEDASLVVSFL
jgi:hypothetical protein